MGNFTLAEATGSILDPVSEPVQRFGISVTNVRLVEFVISNDWNGTANDYVGLSQVRFEGFAPVVTIGTPPQSDTNLLGDSHTFSVLAAGPPTVGYQWVHKQPEHADLGGDQQHLHHWPAHHQQLGRLLRCGVFQFRPFSDHSVAMLTVPDTLPITPVAATAKFGVRRQYWSGLAHQWRSPDGRRQHSGRVRSRQSIREQYGYAADPVVNGTWVAFDLGVNETLTSADIWQMNQDNSGSTLGSASRISPFTPPPMRLRPTPRILWATSRSRKPPALQSRCSGLEFQSLMCVWSSS